MATLIESNLTIAITVDIGNSHIGVIHASSPLNWQDAMYPNPEDTEYQLWSREQFINSRKGAIQDNIRNIDAVVHGHVCSSLTVGGNQIWIDTMWTEGQLTIIESKQVLELLLKDKHI